ncbi:MAG: YigZ family protein [Butyricicoccus porcorum]|nr:YigZ family protein [Butyricicoccus porcorum]
MNDSYLVPAGYGEGLYEDRRSKFIGEIFPVETPEEAIARIAEVKAKYRDARHHCYAYIIREGNYMRYSDDGEPQGTAGMPMLDVLRRENITNVCCVVTRYFGGVLLGTGGLVRAYTKSAQLGLEAAGINQMSSYSVLLITCPYSLLGVVQNILPEHDCMTDDIEYAADVTLTVTLPEGGEEVLAAALRDATSAAVDVEVMESRFMGRHLR